MVVFMLDIETEWTRADPCWDRVPGAHLGGTRRETDERQRPRWHSGGKLVVGSGCKHEPPHAGVLSDP